MNRQGKEELPFASISVVGSDRLPLIAIKTENLSPEQIIRLRGLAEQYGRDTWPDKPYSRPESIGGDSGRKIETPGHRSFITESNSSCSIGIGPESVNGTSTEIGGPMTIYKRPDGKRETGFPVTFSYMPGASKTASD